METGEVWKDIPGYGGHYQASNLGRIRVKDRVVIRKHSTGKPNTPFFYKGRLLKPYKADKVGHLSVTIGFDGRVVRCFVHRLVLFAFVGPCPEGMEACHNNGIADDNRIENLRWDTHLSNNRDRKAHGKYATGTKHPMAKFSDELVAAVALDPCSGVEASRKYGVSRTHGSRIRNGLSRPC